MTSQNPPSREEISQLEKRMDAENITIKDGIKEFKDEVSNNLNSLTTDIKDLTKNMSQVSTALTSLIAESKLVREYQVKQLDTFNDRVSDVEILIEELEKNSRVSRQHNKEDNETNAKMLTVLSSRLKVLEDKAEENKDKKKMKVRAAYGAFGSLVVGVIFLLIDKFSE